MANCVQGKIVNRTVLGASEDFALYCDICAESKEFRNVHGYCENCGEYLCEACFDYHLKPRPSRNHKLLKKDDMPKELLARDKRANSKADSEELCKEHSSERLNFYCPVHEKFYCGTCIALKHRDCEDVEYLSEVADDYTSSETHKFVEENVDNLLSRAGECKSRLSAEADANENQNEKVLKQIDNFRETLIDELNKREEEVTQQVNEHTLRKVEKISDKLEMCETVISEVENLKKEISSLKTNKQYGKLYLLTRKNSEQLKNFDEKLSKTEYASEMENFEFFPNTNLAKLLSKSNAFGHIDKQDTNAKSLEDSVTNTMARAVETKDAAVNGKLKQQTKCTPNKSTSNTPAPSQTLNDNNPFVFKKLHSSFDIDIKSFSVENKPWITGITNINESDQHAVAVYNSQLVAVIDSRQKKILAEKKLQSSPWDVTSVRTGEIIATLPYKNKLVFIKATSVRGQPSGAIEMKVIKYIDVNGDCHSITSDGENIYVSYQKPGKIEVLTLDGTVVKNIECGTDGKQLFTEPQYVVCNENLKLLYVTDWKTNAVTCLTTEGHIKATFSDETLKAPTGIAIDKGGNVFVAGYHSNNVLQFSPTFKHVKLALDKRDKVIWPQTLAFSAKFNKVCIGLRNNEVMKIFRVK